MPFLRIIRSKILVALVIISSEYFMASGSSLLSVDAKQNNNNVKRIKLKERPPDGFLKRRIQNNNKNVGNDKNNDIKEPPITDQPTDHPSNSPSVIQSPAPSMTPTQMPSLSTSQKPSLSASLNPSSLNPTTSPSGFPLSTSMPTSSVLDFEFSRVAVEPVIHYEDSFVYFLFSVLISETYQDSITAEEVTNGKSGSEKPMKSCPNQALLIDSFRLLYQKIKAMKVL